jgi:hypothetical protein
LQVTKPPRVAIFDPEAFYPFRSLVKGPPLSDLSELQAIEGFVRAIVLHDEMKMEPEPLTYQEEEEAEWTQEEIEAGGRNVVVAFAPVVEEYGLFADMTGPRPAPHVELSEPLCQVASEFSNAGPGNVYVSTGLKGSHFHRFEGSQS